MIDLTNKMIYMDMLKLVIFFHKLCFFSIVPIGHHFGSHGNKENTTLQNFLFFHKEHNTLVYIPYTEFLYPSFAVLR